MPITYRSYHSEIKISYAAGNLSPDIAKTIARSTRQRWKRKDGLSFWTQQPLKNNETEDITIGELIAINRQLRIQLKALLCLVLLYKEIMMLQPLQFIQVQKVGKRMKHLLEYCQESKLEQLIRRYLPCSFKQWNAWNSKRPCLGSPLSHCRKKHPQQLAQTEQSAIESACNSSNYENWPLISIYYQLLRNKELHCSRSTFYKYCQLMNITRRQVKPPKKYSPILTNGPLKVLHQDITLFRTANGVKHYLYIIRDNYSRAILACKVATVYSSSIALQTLENVLTRFHLLDQQGLLITDGGMENKGHLETWLSRPGMLWRKLVAQLDIIQSNSMAEAANKIIKYRFLYTRPVADTDTLIATAETAVNRYNDTPNAQLFGYTPNEVIAGAKPDRYRFKAQIKAANKQRIRNNRDYPCEVVCRA